MTAAAVRTNWKVVFLEQRTEVGTLQSGRSPTWTMRVPKLFNLRTIPTSGPTSSRTLYDWMLDKISFRQAQAYVEKMLQTLIRFPEAAEILRASAWIRVMAKLRTPYPQKLSDSMERKRHTPVLAPGSTRERAGGVHGRGPQGVTLEIGQVA